MTPEQIKQQVNLESEQEYINAYIPRLPSYVPPEKIKKSPGLWNFCKSVLDELKP